MKLAIVALAASAKTTRAAPVSAAGAADRARGGTRSTAGRNLGVGTVRSLARLTAVLGVCGLACGTAGGALAGQPEQFRYHLVPLDPTVPPGFNGFNPVKVTDNGEVYGTAFHCSASGCNNFVAVYKNSAMTLLHEGSAECANGRGTVGGVIDGQAALFNGHTVTRIPPLPGESYVEVDDVLDNDTAHVFSSTDSGDFDYLYHNGTATQLAIPSDDSVIPYNTNNSGVMTGLSLQAGFRAFRFRSPAGPIELLAPFGQDEASWGAAINNAGDVLGWSFTLRFGGPGTEERVGFWHGSQFQTQFIEGTAAFPTFSNHLYWNPNGLIVITDTNDLNSYLVPRAGVRLNLADLTDTLPRWTRINGVNAHGDLIGVGGPARFHVDEAFLLQRMAPGSAPSVKAPARRHPAASPALAAARLAALSTIRDSAVSKEKRVRK